MSLNTAAALLGAFQPHPKPLRRSIKHCSGGQQARAGSQAAGGRGRHPRGGSAVKRLQRSPPATHHPTKGPAAPMPARHVRLCCPPGSTTRKNRPGAAAAVPGRQEKKSDFPTRRPCPAQDTGVALSQTGLGTSHLTDPGSWRKLFSC